MLEAVYLFSNTETEGPTEIRVVANAIELRNGWILSFWNGTMVASAKAECLKACYLEEVEI